ncbi:ATP-binding cassette domain-containing protein [Enterococcus faecalis]|nr:ATP-binding cassette domain-containing protein [Enterococcus faecalis]
MLELNDYTLKINNKLLLEHTKVSFRKGVINHILGKNGVGKSQFAKDLLLNRSGLIPSEISKNVTIISSFSNVPNDLKVCELFILLEKRFGLDSVAHLAHSLHATNISKTSLIGQLSDGQKQKLKLLSFFLEDKSIIVLDEITNALDKQTINEIYLFLLAYIKNHPKKIILNITHNLSDLKNLKGNYYLIEDFKLKLFRSILRGEILELKKTISNKIMIILIAIIVAIFAMGWILPIGIDKVTRLSYREYLFSTYTVFTQFGFLMFSFLVSFFINKEYSGKTILFYRMMNTNSLTFYIKKVLTLTVETLGSILVLLFIVSFIFMDFSVILQMFFLLSMISIQYILIVALISFLSANVLLSIGFSILYWITTVLFVAIGGFLRFFAIFDASNELYLNVQNFLEGSENSISFDHNLLIILYIIVLTVIALAIARVNNKRWLRLGV